MKTRRLYIITDLKDNERIIITAETYKEASIDLHIPAPTLRRAGALYKKGHKPKIRKHLSIEVLTEAYN